MVEEKNENILETESGTYIQITISDTGIGMDEITKSQIYEPFFTTKEPGLGTGLGLAFVYGTIKNHKGIIEVKSSPNKGTDFFINLPTINKPNIEKSERPEVDNLKPMHILAIDDEEQILRVIAKLLINLLRAVFFLQP